MCPRISAVAAAQTAKHNGDVTYYAKDHTHLPEGVKRAGHSASLQQRFHLFFTRAEQTALALTEGARLSIIGLLGNNGVCPPDRNPRDTPPIRRYRGGLETQRGFG